MRRSSLVERVRARLRGARTATGRPVDAPLIHVGPPQSRALLKAAKVGDVWVDFGPQPEWEQVYGPNDYRLAAVRRALNEMGGLADGVWTRRRLSSFDLEDSKTQGPVGRALREGGRGA